MTSGKLFNVGKQSRSLSVSTVSIAFVGAVDSRVIPTLIGEFGQANPALQTVLPEAQDIGRIGIAAAHPYDGDVEQP